MAHHDDSSGILANVAVASVFRFLSHVEKFILVNNNSRLGLQDLMGMWWRAMWSDLLGHRARADSRMVFNAWLLEVREDPCALQGCVDP